MTIPASLVPLPPRSRSIAPGGRLLIVSNRLPMTMRVHRGTVEVQRSSGGLATGLHGVHSDTGGIWIGWPGLSTEQAGALWPEMQQSLSAAGAAGIPLSRHELDGFYSRFSNGALWPVLHDRVDHPAPDDDAWALYRAVNERYAEAVIERLRPGDRIWVHDYQLMLVPRLVRERCPHARIGFFLHTPFPDPSSFATLLHGGELLDGLLGADVIGFHTCAYARRFLQAVSDQLHRPIRGDDVLVGSRRIRVGAFPMGIDVASFDACAAEPEVRVEVQRLRGTRGVARMLGVDRLDYTKGISERLLAFERLLTRSPEWRGRVQLSQLAVPSREDVRAYRSLREHVEQVVNRINGAFARPGWTPVEYRYGSMDMTALVALYRAADVMLVTPIRDGMNLVAKEFVASRSDCRGALVLGERAGAAEELRSSLLVDPTDTDALVRSYHTALEMTTAEQRTRMRGLRHIVAGNDVFRWAAGFLETLDSRTARRRALALRLG
jgi:trehalose 6-phosphate synthase/phosphatase